MKNIQRRFFSSIIIPLVGAVIVVAAFIVLIGWELDITILKTFGLSAVTMKPNAAVSFIFAGLTLILLQFSHPISKLIYRFFTVLVLLIGILTVAEYAFRLDFGIDGLFYQVSDTTGYIPNPSRMALNAALSFLFLNIVFLFLSFEQTRSNYFTEFCLIIVLSISVVGLLGFALGLSDAVGAIKYTRMAVNTAVLFIILFFGVYSAYRQRFTGTYTIEQKFFAGLTVILNVFLFILGILLANTNQMYQVRDLVQKTEKIKMELLKIDVVVPKVSNSGHRFLLTEDGIYLEKFHKSVKEVSDILKNLSGLTSTDTLQQKELKRLDPLVQKQIEVSQMMIDLRKASDPEKVEHAMEIDSRSESINDSILSLTSQMLLAAEKNLKSLNSHENKRSRQVMIAVMAGFLFQMFLLTLIFIFVKKDLSRRRKEKMSLFKLNEDLEKRVLERTKALQQSENKYRTIFENIQDVFFQTDMDGTIIEISPSICHLADFVREEIIGHHVNNVYFNSIDRIKLIDIIMRNGEIRDYELCIKTKTNEIKYASINAILIYDSNNNPIHIEGMVRDITQRKKSDSQLELLSWAIDQSPITIVITDKSGMIEYVNPKFTEVTGYKANEVIGQSSRILSSGYHNKKFYEELWSSILAGKEWQGEFYNKKKNGELYWERSIISNVVNLQGDISSFISISEDITDKKRILADLIETKKQAEESNNLKAAFLNNISHEIRTPFTGILGFLGALQEEGLTAPERADYISIINKSAYKFMNTINDIAEMSQIHAGLAQAILSETNLELVILELHERTLSEIENKGLQFNIFNELIHNKLIITDTKKLNAILDVLLSNAIKFTNKGAIELRIRMSEGYLEFSVKDTGIGIPENKQQEIFEAFRQADNSTTRQFDGLGLGLSIAKAYVHMLNGIIWVESKEGKGSIFRFTISCNTGFPQ